MSACKSLVSRRRGPGALILVTAALMAAGNCTAQELDSAGSWHVDEYFAYTSVYTRHTDPSPEHNNHQNMLGLELEMHNHWLFGLAMFDNSFEQSSEYLYFGYRFEPFRSPDWYVKLSGGLVHGYNDPYQHKIPLNGLGIAPAALPTLGYQHKSLVAEVSMAGLAAVVVTAGVRF